jgi:tetratricopeptide (TPR) repeat protein
LGVVYLHIGLLDRARAELEKALEAKPSNTIARLHLGIANEYEGNYEVALATFKSIPRATNPILYDRNMAETLIELGRLEEASAIVDDYLKYETDEGGSVTSVKAMLLAEAGKQDEAEEAIQRAIKIGQNFGHFHHTAYNIGVAYALLNKPTEAIEWLQVSAETGFPCYPWFANHARLNSLRTDERFRAFLAKVKQQWENYKATM